MIAEGKIRYAGVSNFSVSQMQRAQVEKRYGRAFVLRMAPELAAMRLLGATRHDADAIRLTRLGMYCWVLMMAEFFNAVNDVREQMREHIRAELEAWNEEARVPVAAIGRPSREVRT